MLIASAPEHRTLFAFETPSLGYHICHLVRARPGAGRKPLGKIRVMFKLLPGTPAIIGTAAAAEGLSRSEFAERTLRPTAEAALRGTPSRLLARGNDSSLPYFDVRRAERTSLC